MDVKEKVLQVMRSRAPCKIKLSAGNIHSGWQPGICGWQWRRNFLMKNGVRQICAKFLWSWLKTEQYPKIPMPAGLVRRYGDWR